MASERNATLLLRVRAALGGVAIAWLVATPAMASELPQPCSAGACGLNGPAAWVSDGQASAIITGSRLDVTQLSDQVILNWESFNIGSDSTVNFSQPSATATALNRIFQADPSRIFGALQANGRVFLINRNGIVFGQGAQVNVGGLVASSLDITEEAIENGIATAGFEQRPAFESFFDEDGNPLPSGAVNIEQGALIDAPGGQVLVFAPEITNEGIVRAPDGQILFAAGDSIFLLSSDDPSIRGLLVEVGVGGTVTNGSEENAGQTDPVQMLGQLIAERGNITLAGLAVNQQGRVTATTSVRVNGTVRLQARDGGGINALNDTRELVATNNGTLTVGESSITEVALDTTSSDTTVDVNEQPQSRIEMFGNEIRLLDDARVLATGGDVSLVASTSPQQTPDSQGTLPQDDSRIYIASGAVVDVSGAETELPIERNIVEFELRGNELADSPLQRDGPLRGETVRVDIRNSGVREDGIEWQGTPLADASGVISTIERDVVERNLAGGTVSLVSQGDVIVDQAATIDISGGQIAWQDGFINTTQLASNGQIIDIADADPNQSYQGVADAFVVFHERWGVTEFFPGFDRGEEGIFTPGYIEGKDAGTLRILAPDLILDGEVLSQVVVGPLQRQPTTLFVQGGDGLYRDFNEVPLGGLLELGRTTSRGSPVNFFVPNVTVASGLVLPDLVAAGFDPLTDPLPETVAEARLRPSLFGGDAPSRWLISSNGTFTIVDGADLTGNAGGSLDVQAPQIVLNAGVSIDAGTIELTARELTGAEAPASITVGEDVVLATRGQWVNESLVLNPEGSADPLWIDGGDITLSVQDGGVDGASLTLAEGSVLDASGGALLDEGGELTGGVGGDISLSARPSFDENPADVAVTLDGTLRSYGVQSGGELALSVSEICIAGENCAPVSSTGETAGPAITWLAPSFFNEGGFSSFALESNFRGLTVAPGTVVAPIARNLVIDSSADLAPTGSDIFGLGTLGVRPLIERAPVNVSLTVRAFGPSGQGIGEDETTGVPISEEEFNALGRLEIGTGAAIVLDPRGVLDLASNSMIIIDGDLSAPAGDITLTLNTELNASREFLDTQAIWLDSNASLSTRGTVIFEPDDLGRTFGEVLDAGDITLNAIRGYIVTAPTSVIDATGALAELDVRSGSVDAPVFTPTAIGSDGGTITLAASEGALINGIMQASAADGGGASGGVLAVILDANDRAAGTSIYPDGTRSLVLTDDAAPVVVSPGLPVSRDLNGQAVVSADAVADGGFDSLELRAINIGGGAAAQSVGEIVLDGDIDLSLGRSVVLDAASVRSTGGDVEISAPYVAIGPSPREFGQVQPDELERGEGSASFSADLLDITGNTTFQGFDSLAFIASLDIRFNGRQPDDGRNLEGSLVSTASMDFVASQLYPTTLSEFTVAVRNNSDGQISVSSNGSAPQTVLSAGGSLTLDAPIINQAGTLRAPLGSVVLNAGDLRLQPGSVTSTSANGETILFGSTQAGAAWVYALEENQTLVFEPGFETLPSQRIELNADVVDFADGAVVDLSGGGDLLAYEFAPGLGGSRDLLSPDVSPNTFAVIPGLNATYAPFDPQEYRGVDLSPGDSVYLFGGGGLAEGEYALLPARYALLPGAFLVTAVSGTQDLVPNETLNNLDGTTIVAGYRSVAGTDIRDPRISGFEVRSAEILLTQAQYSVSTATEFFPEQAAQLGTATTRLPFDSGVLAIVAGESLNLAGSLQVDPAAGGRGGAVDIGATQLIVTGADAAGEVPEGFVALDAASLQALGAESLLIGGLRSESAEGTVVDVTSSVLRVRSDASLSGAELLLTATDELSVESTLDDEGNVSGAATLSADNALASDSVAGTVIVDGDGALVRLSSGSQVVIDRRGSSGATGSLDIQSGVTLAAVGSIALDASADTVSRGVIDVAGGSLNLGASRISFGADADADIDGLLISDDLLASLIGVSELVLTSRSTVDFFGAGELVADALAFNAAGVYGEAVDGEVFTIAADTVAFSNPNGAVASPADALAGELLVNAGEISFDGGDFSFDGFASTSLSAVEQLVGTRSTQVNAAGDLTLGAARITTASATDLGVTAAGDLSVFGSDAALVQLPVDALGGRIALTGASVDFDGTIELPAGIVELSALDGDLTLGDSALIRAAGRADTFADAVVASPGGRVSLTAEAGNVSTATGSMIDLSGAAGGDAGALMVFSPTGNVSLLGQLAASADSDGRGGSLQIDADAINELDALLLASGQAGFDRALDLRVRGAGDLIVGPDVTVNASQVRLTADQARVRLRGNIDASGADGGDVLLQGGGGIVVSGSIDASATAEAGTGGEVGLFATAGGVELRRSGRIDLSGDTGGRLHVRLPREEALSVLNGDAGDDALILDGAIVGADRTTIEGYATYTLDDGRIDSGDVGTSGNPWFDEAAAFAAEGEALAVALGLGGDTSLRVLPGIELVAEQVDVTADWNLFPWRFAGLGSEDLNGDGVADADLPGVLTIRSAGDITFDRASLSDGFSSATSSVLQAGESWSYRLVAGADLASADLFAVGEAGNLTVAPGQASFIPRQPPTLRYIRTGTGDIDIATGGDLIFSNQQSTIYTAGRPDPAGGFALPTLPAIYPADGGDISIATGGDIIGAPSDTLISGWLWRAGRPAGEINASALGWTVNYAYFEQNLGALGGGDISIASGGDIVDLSAAIPSIGRQDGGQRPEDSVVTITGGGNLDVYATGDILGGNYYVDLGEGSIRSDGEIGPGSEDLGLLLALGDSIFDVQARASVLFETALNPTFLPGTIDQDIARSTAPFFSSYTDRSAVSLTSLGGDVTLSNDASAVEQSLDLLFSSFGNRFLTFYPGTVRATALRGDVSVEEAMALAPAPKGNLELLADQNVILASEIVQSDTDPALAGAPTASSNELATLIRVGGRSFANFHAPVPVHSDAAQPDGIPDTQPVLVVARDGSIVDAGSFDAVLLLAEAATLLAGENIQDIRLIAQNVNPGDVTRVIAGNDVFYTAPRTESGNFDRNLGEITVDGPGRLEVLVGGDIDLQTSSGITTRGDLENPALADTGASVSIITGLGDQQPDYATFVDTYVVGDTLYDAELIAFAEAGLGEPGLDRDAALVYLNSLDDEDQLPLVETILFAELTASGRSAAQSGDGDFSRGFAAVETLFPGSAHDDPDTQSAYEGDLLLFFSRVYTLDGGDINLIVPGGLINAGLATPPAAFGVAKEASELGVVAQGEGDVNALLLGNFEVNESRVFAADGGNILIWASEGDIDAGRGAKTAISAPPPIVTFDEDGNPQISLPPALTGSGIQTLATSAGREPGNVDLFAPIGVVIAGDAGIVAGNLTVAATDVIGADNIDVSGVSVGVPVDAGGLASSLTGVSNIAQAATEAAEEAVVAGGEDAGSSQAPLADAALGWLEATVLGFGDEIEEQIEEETTGEGGR